MSHSRGHTDPKPYLLTKYHENKQTLILVLCQELRTERIVRVPSGHLRGIEAGPVILCQWNSVLDTEWQVRISQ